MFYFLSMLLVLVLLVLRFKSTASTSVFLICNKPFLVLLLFSRYQFLGPEGVACYTIKIEAVQVNE